MKIKKYIKEIVLGLGIFSMSINGFSWTGMPRIDNNHLNDWVGMHYGKIGGFMAQSNIDVKSIIFINALFDRNLGESFDVDSPYKDNLKLLKLVRKEDHTRTSAGGNDHDYSYTYYSLDIDKIKQLYPDVTDEMVGNPLINRENIINVNSDNRYSDGIIDNKLLDKANQNGDNITNVEDWRVSLNIDSIDDINRNLLEKANLDASNLSEDDVIKWKEKLGTISEDELRGLLKDKYNVDGSDLTEEVKVNLINSMNLFKKNEVHNIFDKKINIDGSNFNDNTKTDIKNESNRQSFRNNIGIYSKKEQDTLFNKKVNKNGSNFNDINNSKEENENNKKSFREVLNVDSKEEFDARFDEILKYTKDKIDVFEKELNKMNKKGKSGVASAMAMANLPQPVEEGNHGVNMGIAGYEREGAVAIGYSKVTKDAKLIWKGTISMDTEKRIAGGLGFTYYLSK